LKVGKVDASRRRIRVEESITDVGGRLVLGPPKTHETRTVIVPRFVIDRILPLLEDKDHDDLVFSAPQGGPVRLNNSAIPTRARHTRVIPSAATMSRLTEASSRKSMLSARSDTEPIRRAVMNSTPK
jgi:hypothetical protein